MTVASNFPVSDGVKRGMLQRSLLATIVRDVWSSRELLHQLVQRDLRLRYRQAVMGFGWAIFMPILTVGAGLVIRAAVTQNGIGGGVASIGSMALKAWAWTFFAGAMNFATMSLLSNVSLVTKIYFPREVLPLASIATQCVDSLIGLTLILLVGIVTPVMAFQWSLQALWLLPMILLLVGFTTGLALVFACANLFFRDVKYILQVLLTFGIFSTPVFFEPSAYSPRVAWLIMANPISPMMEGLSVSLGRGMSLLSTVVEQGPHGPVTIWSPGYFAYAVAVTIIAIVVA